MRNARLILARTPNEVANEGHEESDYIRAAPIH
jgi:hypothetical protein